MMRRRAPAGLCCLLLLGLLTACVGPAPTAETTSAATVVRSAAPEQPPLPDALGRVGRDGGPPVADRGIGGTGIPVTADTTVRTADRGIGGTGVANTGVANTGVADTGIIGVITGFGSVFVNGEEIRFDDNALIDIDGSASSALALRAGQLVAIEAGGAAGAPRATAISVRSAVAGQIEAMEPASGSLRIAGQDVWVTQTTWGADRFGPGDWVRVSGLRGADGTILASRLDSAPKGTLLVRGRLVREGNAARIGSLMLSEPMIANVSDGQFVVVSGGYGGEQARVRAVAPDLLFANPGQYFGASTNRLILQAFVQVNNGSLFMNGVKVNAVPDVSETPRHDGIAIVSLQRGTDLSYTATALRYVDLRGHTQAAPASGERGVKPGASLPSGQSGHAAAALNDGDARRLANVSVSDDADPLNGSATTSRISSARQTPARAVRPRTLPASASSVGRTAEPATADGAPGPTVEGQRVATSPSDIPRSTAGSSTVAGVAPAAAEPAAQADISPVDVPPLPPPVSDASLQSAPSTPPATPPPEPVRSVTPPLAGPAAPDGKPGAAAKDPLISSTGGSETGTASPGPESRRLRAVAARRASSGVGKGNPSGPPSGVVTGAVSTTAGDAAPSVPATTQSPPTSAPRRPGRLAPAIGTSTAKPAGP